MDEQNWENLFEMAESFKEEDEPIYNEPIYNKPIYDGPIYDNPIYDGPIYDNASFYENSENSVNQNNQNNINYKNNQNNINNSYKTPEEALKVLFGYDAFRPGQKDIIDNILQGRDAFAVMPTGAGKSVCYQIPAMLLHGITLVISPLISLMQDQVKALNEAGVSAAFINSTLTDKAYFETVDMARMGLFKIIYVAPERLVTEGFLQLASEVEISMITVDEAHCISQWGQDFRPSYMKIVKFVEMLKKRPIISAFTATATENVREDIICTLGLNDPYTLVTGFDRENLFFQVDKPRDKDKYIVDYIACHEGESGIIYCATRKNVDAVYEMLRSKGISVGKYHAGMGANERKQMQDDFVYDYTSIVVATNAFGMGIDKSNVRFVIHYNMPQSMENYYQEAGRAGRDGLDSKCILLFSPQDIVINRFLIERKDMSELDTFDMETVIERDNQRLQAMERYCYTTDCLRNYILKYFGENPGKPCEDCGNCLREFETLDMTEAAKQFINCVYEARGRYGKNIIIDTVAGAKTARLEEIGVTHYKTYGALADVNKNLLRRLVEQMLLEDLLVVGDYQTIKLGNINKLKEPDAKVLLKITDEDKENRKAEKTPKAKKASKGMEALTSAGFKLFDRFRELRLEIAREENMPPYIIFNDKTLIDMAAKVPTSKEEMLAVSGVGENKFEKYGERFIEVVEACIANYPELAENKANMQRQQEEENAREAARVAERMADLAENKTKKKASRKTKEEFNLLKEEAENFKYLGYMYINDIRDELNRICLRENVKKLPSTRLMEILTAEELIVDVIENGFNLKAPTEKGVEAGIRTVKKISDKGNEYTVLMYPEEVQRMLVERYVM